MDSNRASEHLQVIRTLMERSAIYRRALAPVMLVAGAIGIAAAIVPCFRAIETNRAFALFWSLVSLITLLTAYLMRRSNGISSIESPVCIRSSSVM